MTNGWLRSDTALLFSSRVQRALEDQPEKLVYVKGDKDATYSAIMDAMDALRRGRIENIALITDPKQLAGGSTSPGMR